MDFVRSTGGQEHAFVSNWLPLSLHASILRVAFFPCLWYNYCVGTYLLHRYLGERKAWVFYENNRRNCRLGIIVRTCSSTYFVRPSIVLGLRLLCRPFIDSLTSYPDTTHMLVWCWCVCGGLRSPRRGTEHSSNINIAAVWTLRIPPYASLLVTIEYCGAVPWFPRDELCRSKTLIEVMTWVFRTATNNCTYRPCALFHP